MIISQKSKKIRTLFFVCFYVIASGLQAQINETLQYSSIESLSVEYSVTNTDIFDTLSRVVSKSIITLKSNSNVSVLHFKILNTVDQSVVYKADYSMNVSPVMSAGGIILFKKEAAVCYITSAMSMPIGMYQYQLTTEDSQGVISEVYTEFK